MFRVSDSFLWLVETIVLSSTHMKRTHSVWLLDILTDPEHTRVKMSPSAWAA